MSSLVQAAVGLPVSATPAERQWYAVHTRPRHEKKVVQELQERGITTFLPMSAEVRRWSDRRKVVEVPLFPCYAFVQIAPTPEMRLEVLGPYGVLGFVGPHHGTPVPTSQIEDIRALVLSKVPIASEAYIKAGQRVRVCSGALQGMEGVVVGARGARRLVVSIDAIQRSVSVTLEGYEVEPV